MKIKHFVLFGALLLAANGIAQSPTSANGDKTTAPLTYSPQRSSVPISLDLSAGLNYADCYDVGTVPFTYDGIGTNLGMGVTIEWGRCHLRPAFRSFSNTLTNPAGVSQDLDFSAEFLYRVFDNKNNRLHLWAGVTLDGFIDVKSIPSLQNAATCLSVFGDLGATGLLEFDFAFNNAKTHHWLTTYFKLNVPLYGCANRPGFAYIGNPAINQNAVETLFSKTETFGKFFPGLNTDLGLTLNLLNGNRIGLSYRWDYLSTGKKGTYRFDNALHSFNVSFMFRVN